MRILALKADGYVLPSIHDSIINAFRSIGIDILDVKIAKTASPTKDLPALVTRACRAVFALDLGRDSRFIAQVCDLQKRMRVPWLVWFVDDPEGYGFPETCDPRWTIPFCWDRVLADRYADWGGVPAIHLPLAADPSRFSPIPSNERLRYPKGVFVGATAHPNPILEKVIERDPEILVEAEKLWRTCSRDFGIPPYELAWRRAEHSSGRPDGIARADPLWKLRVHASVFKMGLLKRLGVVSNVMADGGAVFGDRRWGGVLGARVYKGRVAYGEALRRVYGQSAFVLDIRQPQARTGLSQRIFDAYACGRPIVAEWSEELEALFDEDERPFFFSNLEQAFESKQQCLDDPEAARKRAEKARSRVLSQHTYIQRARCMLEVLNRFGFTSSAWEKRS